MTFTLNVHASARRHLTAAKILKDEERHDVAGYLFGIAAECAIKAMMLDAGFRPTHERENDPFYQHFPQLRTTLRSKLSGRRAATLLTFISNDKFFSQWSTDMRYCKGDEIRDGWVELWSEQARQAVASIGT